MRTIHAINKFLCVPHEVFDYTITRNIYKWPGVSSVPPETEVRAPCPVGRNEDMYYFTTSGSNQHLRRLVRDESSTVSGHLRCCNRQTQRIQGMDASRPQDVVLF